jgi:hypothetical protein
MAVLDSKSRSSFGGWSWKVDLTDDAGLVLSEVSHAGFSFATDMRLVKIWVSNASPDTTGAVTREFLPGSPDLPANPASIQERASPTVTLIRPYVPILELAATLQTQSAVLGGTSLPLRVEQSFIFTDYSRTPVHEPGAILSAARCYPVTRFSYAGGQNAPPMPRYIRFDYRFDISIDASLQVATKGKVPLIDQAGVFADTETQFVPTIGSIFARVEKPLAKEIIGQGLNYGLVSDWDNIHQWGAQDPLPSTPGAFHAAHTHWRWGASAALGQLFPPLKGAPHFAGLGGPGGPLIDPRARHQDIRFAVTGRGTDKAAAVSQWSPGNHPSTRNYDDLFTTARPPAPIDEGAVLTQWFSIVVTRGGDEASQNDPWEAAVFIHGYFFAHEQEDLMLLGPVAGVGATLVGGLKNAITKEQGISQENGWVRK